MKENAMTKSLILSLVMAGFVLGAECGAADSHHDPMCSGVAEACQKAGYSNMSSAAHKRGKSLSDCMDKVVEGEKVKGVTLDPADPALGQCKAVFKAEGASAAGKKSSDSHTSAKKSH
jgi:hypothetical protein